ncbi:MBL fold metallo-hydrolase [bacterium]|nr:MBL fold metallo-hydrolase [bacterium]
MITVHQFTYNPFSENTYLLIDKDNKGVLIDPGMSNPVEYSHFFEYIQKHKIELVDVLLTHAHVDHVFGLNWVHKQFGLKPKLHKDDEFIYNAAEATANMYGLEIESLPDYELSLNEGDVYKFDGEQLHIVHTPGHSPGSVSFISNEHRFVIGGDVLFQGSIGRTDLPGGNYDTLIRSIKINLLQLTDDYKVYSGHGPITTIGQERIANPFLQDV